MNQRQKYPPLCEVVTTRELKGVEHSGVVYGYVGVGTHGHVQGHTEDGRAMFVLNGAIHTFDDPDSYFVIIKLPEPDYRQKYKKLLAWAKSAYAALEYDEHAADVTRTAPDEVKL